jgi:hypothetical protein
MKLLKQYFKLQQEIFDYFGYREDWAVIPLEDSTDYYWYYTGKKVWFSEKPFTVELIKAGQELYSHTIYTQRHLPKWDYIVDDPDGYSMFVVDTHTDGNKFLQVFANNKRLIDPPQEIIDAFQEWAF